MASATLSSGLQSMTPVDNEASAIQSFVNAWSTYFGQSQVAGIVATPGSYAAALSAMQSAMSGLSQTGGAAAAIQSGIVAFWGAIIPTAIWITAPIVLVPPAIPPAGLTGISAALASTFSSNTSGDLSLADASNAVAGAIHGANTGATVPGSVPPNPPAPLPIT